MRKNGPFRVAVGILLIPTAMLFLAAGCGNETENRKQADSASISDSAEADTAEEDFADAVLVLDGDAVSAAEYGMLAQEYSNQVSMQYSTDEVNSEDFWETDYDGVYPYEQLAELIENELRENYAIKTLAVELNVTEDYTFEDMEAAMEEENDSAENSSDDEISYGLTGYSISTYYSYWYSNLETQVVNALLEDEIEVSEDDCLDYYNDHAESYTYDVGVELIYAEFSGTTDEEWEEAQELADRMLTAADVSALEEEFPDAAVSELSLTSLDKQEGLSGVYSNRWEIASGLTDGEVYGPYQDNGVICVMKCVSRTENGLAAFSDAQAMIESYLRTQAAQEVISQRAKELEVTEGGISVKSAITSALAG